MAKYHVIFEEYELNGLYDALYNLQEKMADKEVAAITYYKNYREMMELLDFIFQKKNKIKKMREIQKKKQATTVPNKIVLPPLIQTISPEIKNCKNMFPLSYSPIHRGYVKNQYQ